MGIFRNKKTIITIPLIKFDEPTRDNCLYTKDTKFSIRDNKKIMKIWWWFGYHGLYQINWWWKRNILRYKRLKLKILCYFYNRKIDKIFKENM